MRPAFQFALVALALSASLPVVARADARNTDRGSFFVADPSWFAAQLRATLPHGAKKQSDASAAGAAFTLLIGSVAVLAGKRRKDP